MKKQSEKKIETNEVKQEKRISFPSIQEKICEQLIKETKKFKYIFVPHTPTEREIEMLKDEFIQREITKQKILILSELIIS